jgi:hypothetical protein
MAELQLPKLIARVRFPSLAQVSVLRQSDISLTDLIAAKLSISRRVRL